jgi:ribose transport system ATP-binding protein
MAETILEMKKIKKHFPGVLALNDVDFDLRKGEVHVLIGENGAGKSTLIKILSGVYKVDGGEIFIDGKKRTITCPNDAKTLGIGVIYQELSLLPLLTVGENLFLGQLPHKPHTFAVDWKRVYGESQQFLDKLGLPINSRETVKGMGIGRQQMIEVVKVLASNARIIIMDEPTSSLSDREIERLFSMIQMLKEKGISIIYISHRLNELWKIGDRVTVLKDGCLVKTIDDIEGITSDELVNLMVGRKFEDSFARADNYCDRNIETLRVENLTRDRVFENISLVAHKGEIVGIAGLVGAGRTEVVSAIFGVDRCDSGKVFVNGKHIAIKSPKDAIKYGIGLVPEDRKEKGLVLRMSVKDNVTLASLEQFMDKLGLAVNFVQERKKVQSFVEDLRIKTPGINQIVVNLSGGNQQKVAIAKWLCSHVHILIMDEPTRGIDVGAKEEVYQLMNELVKNGATIIMISSELPEILRMSDRIYVLHEGKVIGELSRAEATEEKIMHLAWNS